MTLEQIQFKEHMDSRGGLVAVEDYELPFRPKRVYYIYGVGREVRRGFHAHKRLEQVMICVHGSCKILFDDGIMQKEMVLNNPAEGIYVGTMIWREMYDFSEDAVLMVLASRNYEEEDYIRNYDEFKHTVCKL